MSPSSHQVQESFRRFIEEMADFFSRYSFLREAESGLRAIADSTLRPFNVAVFGRMKTGKSTLINALVGRPLAIMGVEEATATINWISYGEGAQVGSFVVHWKDGRSELLPRIRMDDWTGKDEAVLERVRATSYLELFANADSLKKVQIIDTPGTGSVAAEHQEAATSFIDPSNAEGRKADALIYVFPPVAKASDESSLATFRAGCLPGSDPYNSVGVLHKWDALETDGDLLEEVERKAARLRLALKDVVADVIPVSGPIALLARRATDETDDFFSNLSTALDSAGAEAALRTDERWDSDEARKAVRKAERDLPWASFRLIARLFLQRRPGSVADFRKLCLDFSQIERLESFLEQRFYSQSAIIKTLQSLVRAETHIKRAFVDIELIISDLREDLEVWPRVEKAVSSASSDMAAWVRKKARECETEIQGLQAASVRADQFWIAEEGRIKGLKTDLDMSRRMDSDPSFVTDADAVLIRQLCKEFCADSPNLRERIARIAPREKWESLDSHYAELMQAPNADLRRLYEHLSKRFKRARKTLI